MSEQITPDMIWYTCLDCNRQFTLADSNKNNGCPWCESAYYKHYDESDELVRREADE